LAREENAMARLLSVNVGLPRDIAWRGKTVHTAIWKIPVQGRRTVRRLNIDGDGQGDLIGHGGEHRAVFVYQIDSYHYWQSQLGRNDFTNGQFGENFTVEGLSDQEVCIGDRYRVGGALFEVTQPRVTCYRGTGCLLRISEVSEVRPNSDPGIAAAAPTKALSLTASSRVAPQPTGWGGLLLSHEDRQRTTPTNMQAILINL
jgi:MOSC domain-containing protein YiiM